MVIALAACVGASSGLAAVALTRALHFMSDTLATAHLQWWGFLLPAAGATLSALFINTLLRERPGHGVPEVVLAVLRHGGRLRFRSSFSRLVASCLTIGSGGSAGPEAPVVVSGAALGSNFGKLFGLNERQRVTLVGCGAAGAIGAIFNAPIAGLVFTIEVILGEWRAFNVVPIAIAAVSGTQISRVLQGNQIAFAHQKFDIGLPDIAASFGVAVAATVAAVGLARMINGMHHVAARAPLPQWLRPAVGGAAVGLIGIFLPAVMGEGYHAVQQAIDGVFAQGVAWAALMVAAKMAATTLTLGWGGAGGIFAPSLMIGSLIGLFYYRLLTWALPVVGFAEEGCFALLGMAGMISGILQAPLTGIFLVVEITGGYDVILPLIIVSVLTATFSHYLEPGSFYLRELIEKGDYVRPGTDARVLSDLKVREVMSTNPATVPNDMLLGDFVTLFEQSQGHIFPVIDRDNGFYLGVLLPDRIRPYLFDTRMHAALIVEQVMAGATPTIRVGDDLGFVLDLMDHHGMNHLPVLEENRCVGVLSKEKILDHYRKELIVQTGA
ncbi:MAG: chloride channel protein [Desulfatitalea sp.]|nr:chloride channel protein [Desulfatitalea sp.]